MANQEGHLPMKLFSYIVARDFGFAPNPFYGFCTLATCKPRVRKHASIGDWVIGTGAVTKYKLAGHLIYAMKVEEIMDFDSYWDDPRFACKKPIMNGSLKQLYGDNIYHQVKNTWVQSDSHHSLSADRPNQTNIVYDTSAKHLLIARKFVYFGSAAPVIPDKFRPYQGEDICCHGRGYRNGAHELATALESWLDDRGEWGVQGMPLEFANNLKVRVGDDKQGPQ